jgi:hypothetical protein
MLSAVIKGVGQLDLPGFKNLEGLSLKVFFVLFVPFVDNLIP